MPRNIREDPARQSNPLRVLQGLQRSLELDFPGISDPGTEIVIEKETQTDIVPPGKDPHKKAS